MAMQKEESQEKTQKSTIKRVFFSKRAQLLKQAAESLHQTGSFGRNQLIRTLNLS